jgi:hypothetical protein
MFPKPVMLQPQMSDQPFDFMKNEISLNHKADSDAAFGENFGDFSNKMVGSLAEVPDFSQKLTESHKSVKKESNFDFENKPASELDPQSPSGSNHEKPSTPRGEENMSDNVEPLNRTHGAKSSNVKFLEKKPMGASTPKTKQNDMGVQDEHSYLTNGNDRNNYENRSHRSARHKFNPKIWGDEYVTSITGKRKNMVVENEDKSEKEGSQGNNKVSIRKRDTKVEVSNS